jgi:hypothetical protein
VLCASLGRVLSAAILRQQEQTLTQQQVHLIFQSSTFSPFTLHDKFVTFDDEWMYTFGRATQVASCEQVSPCVNGIGEKECNNELVKGFVNLHLYRFGSKF